MSYDRRLSARCSRSGRLGMCDLPTNHVGPCTQTMFSDRTAKVRRSMPIDLPADDGAAAIRRELHSALEDDDA